MDNQKNNNDIELILPEDRKEDLPPVPNDMPSADKLSQNDEPHHHHHSEHRHSRDHHDAHHQRHSSKKKNEKKKLSTKALWTLTISMLILLIVLVLVFELLLVPYKEGEEPEQMGELTSDILLVEVVNGEGLLIKNAVNKYLLADLLNAQNANVTPSSFAGGEGRLDAQVPVTLKLSVKEGSAISYKVELANNNAFFNADILYVEAPYGSCSFEHLYTNTTYYYRVTVYTGKGADSLTGHFKTADTPRILSIDGLSNVRDIGNWRTDSGKRIKQGLLIRGTEMDGAVEQDYHLTNEGLIDMLDVFGIKTDLDLRAQSPRTQSALGSRVEHQYYDMVMYKNIFSEVGMDKVRMIFSELANLDNYPIYMHCTYGDDRTGTVCYLLEALLGVSRGDCLRDYGLSNLPITDIMLVEEGLKAYPGDSLKAQTEAYLLACGVSEYQIESIRNIFLGD